MKNPFLDINARLVIAHRGNPSGAPENTIESLRQAAEMGADALEFDVRMTRDGIPVLFHDPDLDRTTDGHGRLSRFSLEELRTLDAGARFPGSAGVRHSIPTLEEALDRFRELPFVIEVKEMEAAESTERMVRKFGLQDRVIVGSARGAVMSRFYRTGLASCASMFDVVQLMPFSLAGLTPATPMYDVLSLTPYFHGLPIPIRQMAQTARRLGIPTHVWTVNDPAEAARFWAAGVAAIITDDPGAILRTRPR